MPDEVIEYLEPRPHGVYGDGTSGTGGHAELILEAAPGSRVIGLDKDPAMLEIARERLADYGDRVILRRAGYEDFPEILSALHIDNLDGILLDLGPSRDQLAGRTAGKGRGFSMHADDEPLAMTYDPDQRRTARSLLQGLSESELREMFAVTLRGSEVGSVVATIMRARDEAPVDTPGRLTELLRQALAYKGPTTEKRVAAAYAAVRVAVNRETEIIRRGLDAAVEALGMGGRLIVISFSGHEHGLVRRHLRELEGGPVGPPRLIGAPEREAKVKVITSNPLSPDEDEIQRNPAARSSRMHVAERV
jgi:16S rRNA (cytosine1402-N4)-methyltransferase